MNAPVRFRVVFGVLCIFLFLFSALPVQARDPADFEVILFENTGCVGENRLVFFYDNDLSNLNRFNLPGGEKWNDRISSLAIGKNARVILYQHSDFRDPSISFEGDGTNSLPIADLHLLGWGDTVTSAKIRQRVVPAPDEVPIFEHVNFDGGMLSPSAGGNYPDLRQRPISGGKTWNDKISSIKVGSSVKAEITNTSTPAPIPGPFIPPLPGHEFPRFIPSAGATASRRSWCWTAWGTDGPTSYITAAARSSRGFASSFRPDSR